MGGALGLAAGGAALEVASLRGHFDNRTLVVGDGAARFFAAMQEPTTGMVHLAHSTHVVCIGGLRLLTDPWFFDPAFGALEHSVRPPVAPEDVHVDAILISHDHPDHADLRALDRMQKDTPVLCATTELATRVKGAGFQETYVLAPWESLPFRGVTITATPAEHDAYEIGYVIEAPAPQPFSVYFAGDTRLCPAIDAIAERFEALDLCIVPVDGTRVHTSQQWVMTPEDAIVAVGKLRPRMVIPSHAEARFFDPLVSRLLASEIPGSAQIFAELLRTAHPEVRCALPSPGERISV